MWPLVVYAVAVIVLVTAMLGMSFLLGERSRDRVGDEPYESGIVSTGSARVRLSPQFYLVAMFFVIFDIEAVFLFAWAVAAQELGWLAYAEVVVFVFVLVVALGYLWRRGGLEFGPRTRRVEVRR